MSSQFTAGKQKKKKLYILKNEKRNGKTRIEKKKNRKCKEKPRINVNKRKKIETKAKWALFY